MASFQPDSAETRKRLIKAIKAVMTGNRALAAESASPAEATKILTTSDQGCKRDGTCPYPFIFFQFASLSRGIPSRRKKYFARPGNKNRGIPFCPDLSRFLPVPKIPVPPRPTPQKIISLSLSRPASIFCPIDTIYLCFKEILSYFCRSFWFKVNL